MTVVSGDIRLMWIFAEVLQGGASNDSMGLSTTAIFSVFSGFLPRDARSASAVLLS